MTSTLETLRNVTTGTITTMLLKKGIRRSWMAGAMPFGFSGKRVVRPAFTLRFVPVREDRATPESWSKPISTRSAIEAMPENCVVVADAMGVLGAGIFGDIVVADDDGAVVIPAALADFVASEGAEHELMESWLVQEVEKGAKLPGLYPPNDENKKRYEEWKKKR